TTSLGPPEIRWFRLRRRRANECLPATLSSLLPGDAEVTAMVEASEITQGLLDRAGRGDVVARHELLERYRRYLRSLVAVRLDRRVARRVDASDIVQEALADASERMDHYLRARPLPFLGWLRRLARDRVVDAHRRHLGSLRRSVARERSTSELTDASVAELG